MMRPPLSPRDCGHCGRRCVVAAEWPIGPVCGTCYRYIRTHPGLCPGCSQLAALVGTDDDGRPVCGPCASWSGPSFACQSCGAPDMLENGRCTRCVLAAVTSDLLTLAGPQVRGQLTQLTAALLAARRPRSALWWLRTSGGGQILARLAAGQEPISHALLDQLPPSHNCTILRDRLVVAGVLPERQEYLDRIPAWTSQLVTGKPADHARMIRAYAQWDALRRARRTSRPTPGQAQTVRTKIRARQRSWTGSLLTTGNSPSSPSPAWTPGSPASVPTSGRRCAHFCPGPSSGAYASADWPSRAPHRTRHRAGRRPAMAAAPHLPHRRRYPAGRPCIRCRGPALRRCAQPHPPATRQRPAHHQRTVSPAARPAPGPGATSPCPAAARAGRHGGHPARLSRGRPWLFPGQPGLRPITSAAILTRLNRRGIHIRAGRTAALIDLACELPPPSWPACSAWPPPPPNGGAAESPATGPPTCTPATACAANTTQASYEPAAAGDRPGL